jgi:hypothetical protein
MKTKSIAVAVAPGAAGIPVPEERAPADTMAWTVPMTVVNTGW